MTAHPITIFIVEDQQLTREALTLTLEQEADMTVIGNAATGQAAMKKLGALQPQVILLDLNLSDISGAIVMQWVKNHLPKTRTIILTAQQDVTFPRRLLRAGAVAYLTKDQSAAELIEAVKLASFTNRMCSPKLLQDLALTRCGVDHLQKKVQQLSDRALQVMLAMAQGATTQEIAESLNLTPQTVNCYRHRIHRQLDLPNDIALITLAVKLRLLDSPFPGAKTDA